MALGPCMHIMEAMHTNAGERLLSLEEYEITRG